MHPAVRSWSRSASPESLLLKTPRLGDAANTVIASTGSTYRDSMYVCSIPTLAGAHVRA
jgi:hypothetical protein